MEGQVNVTNGAALTVNVAEQVTFGSQLLVTVKITVLLPPQADGALTLLFDKLALHPPLVDTVASQVA